MFNSIFNTVFSKNAAVENFDFDAEYEAMVQDMNQAYEAEQAEMRTEWASMSDRERRETISWIDELAARGVADTHRFYPYWKARRV